MRRLFNCFVLSAVLAGLFAASSFEAHAQRKKDKLTQEKAPHEPAVIQVPAGTEAKALEPAGVVIRIPAHKVVGSLQSGLLCMRVDDYRLKGGVGVIQDPLYVDRMRAELSAAGYQVIGDPNSIFEKDKGKAELEMAAMITDIKADVCNYDMGVLGQQSGGKGIVQVNWQIYSNLDRKVVFELSTSGKSNVRMKRAGEDDVIIDAFGSAMQQLLADQRFYQFMINTGGRNDEVNNLTNHDSQQNAALPLQPSIPAILISRLQLSSKRFQDHATEIRGNVVTVFSGGSMGSGFFISERHVITNHHVVGAAKFVKVKLITGREILGEVIGSDARRDVALVQTEVSGLPGLPILAEELGIGSPIFVIGSPLDEKNEGTVSAGIVSSYRTEQNQRLIQSDVNIMPGNSGGPMLDDKGNVIGIAVSGLSEGNGVTSLGVNFFIPIAEAMAKLNIQYR